MAKKRPHEEEHADETWLIPYSDLLTLLLALFIVLYSSAQIDQKVFEQLAQSLSNAFRGNTAIFESNRTVPQFNPTPSTPRLEKMPSVMSKTTGESNEDAYMKETVQLLEAKKTIDQYIADNDLGRQLETAFTDDGLMIRIRDTALFPSGSADLIPASRQLAVQIAKILVLLPQRVVISGHTDNVPIHTYDFPSNWELSSRRAINFMKFLFSVEPKLQPERFSAIGYGEYHPIAPNNTPEGRAKNRRVEVLIVRNIHL